MTKNVTFGSQFLLSEHKHASIDENDCFTFVGPNYKTLQTFAANTPSQECTKRRRAIWTREQPKNPLNVPKRSCLQLAAVNTGAFSRHTGETEGKTHEHEHWLFPPGKVGAWWWLCDWVLLFVASARLQHKAICSTEKKIPIFLCYGGIMSCSAGPNIAPQLADKSCCRQSAGDAVIGHCRGCKYFNTASCP